MRSILRLHEKTIRNCEERYATKAEAYFYGLAAGALIGAVAVVILICILIELLS